MNLAYALTLDRSQRDLLGTLHGILGSCSYAMSFGELHAFCRASGGTGLYVVDANNGNLFYEPASPNMDTNQETNWSSLEQRLFHRAIKLGCINAGSLTLEDAFERMGAEADKLTLGMEPTVEVFDLRMMSVALPLAKVKPNATFVAHPTRPIIAMSQREHTSECEPMEWPQVFPRRAV